MSGPALSGPPEQSPGEEFGGVFAEPIDTRLDPLTGNRIESPTPLSRESYWHRLALVLYRQCREIVAEHEAADAAEAADAEDMHDPDECEGCVFFSRVIDGMSRQVAEQAAYIDRLEAIAERYRARAARDA